MKAVSVERLVVSYGKTRAVDAVGFSVARGEHLTLLGPSGCGKTTTLRAVAGLERPDCGRITIAGQTVYDGGSRVDVPPEARGLSMVFQSYAIWPHMTVAENVAFPLRARGISRAETRAAVGRALALVDLAGFADRPATRLSGGQQQRVALARAVAFGTGTVLFDEPLSNLDAQLRVQMRTELVDLRRELGFAAIYVTHDQDEAFSLSDRILLMRAGRIEQEGTPEEMYGAPRTRFAAAFLGVRNVLEAELRGCQARLADGSVLRAAGPDGACAIAFRPGAVVLGQGHPATIHRVSFAGDLLHVFLRSGPIEICAHAHPHPDLRPGLETRWHVPPEACRVLKE